MAPSVAVAEPVVGTSRNLPESSRQQTKRNRTQLSCTNCRHAKLKCDRQTPCSQCVKKGRASLCTFPAAADRKRPAVSMQNRLKHLENLVKGVMTSQTSNLASDFSNYSEITKSPAVVPQIQSLNVVQGASDEALLFTKDDLSKSSGQVVLGPNESTYVGATHWAAILDDIEEVKSYFNEVEGEDALHFESVRPDLTLVFNSDSPATKEDLLAALPERTIVDRLVYKYFNSNSPALHIIHRPTFQKNYRIFWADPHNTPISWLALIYAVMCLATFTALGSGEENADTRGTPMEIIRTYRGCCAQCLVLSNYAQPKLYTLETFLIYMEGEFVLSKDDQMNCYLMVGVVVRLAMRMGLHRDSDNVAGDITLYQAEYRRRIWHLLFQIDSLVSFHIGLPAMVQDIESDTQVPRNLRDEDFNEDTTEMPPSRPETEQTIMSYTLAKGRIARVFSKVARQANLLVLPLYDEVMALDRQLHQAFAALPPFLRVVPMELSITDSPMLIIQRLSLALLFHKSRCVLHRKYLMREKENKDFTYSKSAGIDASMELLYIQSEIHEAVQPGGLLCKDLWFVSSLSMHDFLLAAMIVYLSLIRERESVVQTAGISQQPNTQQAEMIRAMERSYTIWTETASMSVDIKKAYEVLGSMVKRLNSVFGRSTIDKNVLTRESQVQGYNGAELISGLSLTGPISSKGASITTLDLVEGGQLWGSGSTTSSSLTIPFDVDAMPMPIDDSLSAMIDMSTTFDWEAFDNHIRPQQLSDQSWPDLSFPDSDFGGNYEYNV